MINNNKSLTIFLEPLDAFTNSAISRGLTELGLSGDDRYMIMRDGEGNEHPVWQCPYRLAAALAKERRQKEAEVTFHVWIEGPNLRLKDGEFLFRKKRKKACTQ